MKENTREAWVVTAAAMLVLGLSWWEGFVPLLISILLLVTFAAYKNSHSSQGGKARAVIYVLLAVMTGLLDWGAIRALVELGTQVYWSFLVLGATLIILYMTLVWEQGRKKRM